MSQDPRQRLEKLSAEERSWVRETALRHWLESQGRTVDESLLLALADMDRGDYERRIKPRKNVRGL